MLALCSAYLETVRVVPRHRAEKVRVLKQFCADFPAHQPKQIRKCDVLRWIDSHPEWKSDWTIKNRMAIVKAFFTWMASRGHLPADVNPLFGLSHPTGPRGRPITDHQFGAVLRNSAACFRRVLIFIRLTGARPCEVSSLEWDFIDVSEGTATLHLHKTERTRKDRNPRIIYLHPCVVRMLIWIRKRNQGKYVFLNSRGRPWNSRSSLSLRLQRLRNKLMIPKSAKLYSIRHAWATKLAKGNPHKGIPGVGLKTLAELLGHTTVRMAEYYVSLAGDSAFLRSELVRGLK